MISLGKMNRLDVASIEEERAMLRDPEDGTEVTLTRTRPENQGDLKALQVDVFVDRDRDGTLQASLKRPRILVGEVRSLRVVDLTDLGAFLDWGLSHDLFLPHRNHRETVHMGDEVLVALMVNPKGRIVATCEIEDALETGSPYRLGDITTGTLYRYSRDLGAWFVAVDGRYHGMIPRDELDGTPFKAGMTLPVRIKRVRPDGKLDCTARKKAYQTMDADAEKILSLLAGSQGRIALHDKSSPDEIRAALGMSKASFKRAVGRLYKNGQIRLVDGGIEGVRRD